MTAYWLIAAVLVVVNLAVMPYFLFLLATALAAIVARRPRSACRQTRARIPDRDPGSRRGIGDRDDGPSCLRSNYPSSVLRRPGHRRQLRRPDGRGGRSAGARVVERFDAVRRAKATRSSTCSNRSTDRASSTRSTPWSSSTPTPRSTPICCARSTRPCAGSRLDSGLLHRGEPRSVLAHPADDLCLQPV